MKKNYLFTLVLMFATQLFWAQITVTTTATFSTCAGSASTSQIVTVNDPLPGGNLTVTAPTGFEIKTGVGSYGTSLTISGTGILNAIPSTQIHIRLKSNATGSPSGNVTFVGTARTTRNMSVAGTVNALPTTPAITASGSTAICAGGSVTLTAPSSTGYVWSTGETSRSITVTSAGTYTVTVTNASGCSSATSAGTVVTVNALPSAPTITALSDTTFCQGGSVVLRSSSSTGNLWSNGANTQSSTVSTSGSYTLKRVDANGCTSLNSAATVVSVNALANTPAITASTNASVCQGETVTLTSDESASPLSTYTWSRDGQALRGEGSRTINVNDSGLYTVVVNNGVCNSLPSAVRKVIVNPRPETPTITTSGSTGLCTGGSVTLTSSSTTGNLWSNGAITQAITVSTAGTYSLTVKNSFGCASLGNFVPNIIIEEEEEEEEGGVYVQTSVTVTVSPIPARPTVSVSGATTFCAGGSVTLTSSVANCKWSNGETTQSIIVPIAGTYTVKANNEGCLSQSSLSRTITVNPVLTTPTITVVGGSTALLPGGSITLTSSSATVNRWSTGATTRSIVVRAAGNYTVMVPGTCPSASSTPVVITSGTPQPTRLADTKGAASKIAIYPNPSTGTINVDSDTDGKYYIANQLGQIVKEFKVIKNATSTINVENLKNGVYFVKNQNSNKSTKLIIQK